MNRRALTAQTRTLGPDHPTTLSTQMSLADALFASGGRDEGVAMMRETLASETQLDLNTVACKINFAYVECAFATDDDHAERSEGTQGAVRWNVPEIKVPSTGSTEIGVKRGYGILGDAEIKDALQIDASARAVGDAYVVGGADAGKTLGRYFERTSAVKAVVNDQVDESEGRTSDGHVAVPIASSAKDPSGPIAECAYTPAPRTTFRNDPLEAYVRERSLDGIRTAVLEDGTQVRYGLVKFVEQPALASLAADFPSDFTPAKLEEIQVRFERLTATGFRGPDAAHRAHQKGGRVGASRRGDARDSRGGVRPRRGRLDARGGRGAYGHVVRNVVVGSAHRAFFYFSFLLFAFCFLLFCTFALAGSRIFFSRV